MFDFTEMMKQAQNGQAMLNLARHFGLTPDETAKIVEAMMPAFVAAMQRRMTDPAAAMKMMQAMFAQAGPKNPYLDAFAAFAPETRSAGEQLVGTLFGSREVAAAVTQQVAAMTGMGQQVLAGMMPVIAAMTFGGMGGALESSPFAGMMESFLGKSGAKGADMPDFSAFFSPKAAEAGIAGMMKAWESAKVPGVDPAAMEGMLKATPNPAGPGTPMGDMMSEFLKGFNRGRAPEAKPEPEKPKDIIGQMFAAGKEAQASQTQAFEDIFDRFWGRKT